MRPQCDKMYFFSYFFFGGGGRPEHVMSKVLLETHNRKSYINLFNFAQRCSLTSRIPINVGLTSRIPIKCYLCYIGIIFTL